MRDARVEQRLADAVAAARLGEERASFVGVARCEVLEQPREQHAGRGGLEDHGVAAGLEVARRATAETLLDRGARDARVSSRLIAVASPPAQPEAAPSVRAHRQVCAAPAPA